MPWQSYFSSVASLKGCQHLFYFLVGQRKTLAPLPTTSWGIISLTVEMVSEPTPIQHLRTRPYSSQSNTRLTIFHLGQLILSATLASRPSTKSIVSLVTFYCGRLLISLLIDIGEVWANMLHNVYASLIGAHSWSSTERTNPSGTEGNIVFLHLFIDALPLQPCNPTCTYHRLPTKHNLALLPTNISC